MQALQQVLIIQKPVLLNYKVQFDSTQLNEVMRIVKQFDCVMVQQEMQLFCLLELGIPKREWETVVARLQDLRDVELEKLD